MDNEISKPIEIKEKMESIQKNKVSFASFMDNEQSEGLNEYKDKNMKERVEKQNKNWKITINTARSDLVEKDNLSYDHGQEAEVSTPRWKHKSFEDTEGTVMTLKK